MMLELFAPPDNELQTVSEAPDAGLVESTIRRQPWGGDLDVTFIVLRIDDENWLEVSGNLGSGGLSARYSESGAEHVAEGGPETLDACVSLMLSYLGGDDRWRKMISWD